MLRLIKGVIDLNIELLPEEEYLLLVRSICLYLFQKTLYRLPRREAEDGRGMFGCLALISQ